MGLLYDLFKSNRKTAEELGFQLRLSVIKHI